MSYGFHRISVLADPGGAATRYLNAIHDEFAELGRPLPEGDPEPLPIGDPPPEPAHEALSPTGAREQGFTGGTCDTCGSVRMQNAGTCTVCVDCGTTTGCS